MMDSSCSLLPPTTFYSQIMLTPPSAPQRQQQQRNNQPPTVWSWPDHLEGVEGEEGWEEKVEGRSHTVQLKTPEMLFKKKMMSIRGDLISKL